MCPDAQQRISMDYFLAVTTEYVSSYPVWKSGRNTEAPFILKATVHYPEERILYPCTFFLEDFQRVQTQTKAAYCRILPTLDHLV